ncbi:MULTISPECIES: TnsA-like heteromeric transposase endonuclease subunit [Streptomyces violaceusniger group]|uniref:TnsA-like heteromeric transposase endonuclease subunit n=1 Tax=Streptomyces antimycoticus TaxID=68175 RepID=A0ABD5JNF8_9ACTN|nr:TnsA-like heteromeric transposase endonuclease subunit [Streptomyces violaceusniger]MEE4589987.1 TnsA-like heteromeric transposase endonuclease subunit [Streptomyces sp. DSM 41602]
MPWGEAARVVRLEDCGPVRRFPLRSGRRFAPGWWWSATTGRLVHYGSRTQVMLLDRDLSVMAMACRPVELSWRESEGTVVSHAPHLMARFSDGGGLLLDCAGREEIPPRLAHRADVMAAAARAVGWQYRVASPPEPVVAANLGWLSGYRHPRYRDTALMEGAVRAFARPRPLIEGARGLGDTIRVLPALFHALWTGTLVSPAERALA